MRRTPARSRNTAWRTPIAPRVTHRSIIDRVSRVGPLSMALIALGEAYDGCGRSADTGRFNRGLRADSGPGHGRRRGCAVTGRRTRGRAWFHGNAPMDEVVRPV